MGDLGQPAASPGVDEHTRGAGRIRPLALAALFLAVAAPAALAWPGRPSAPPPKPPSAGAPPAAWIETPARSAWLAYGSYCWTRTCVDMIPPTMRRDLPLVHVAVGATVRVHLGFRPTSLVLSVGTRTMAAKLDRSRRIVTWRATRAGIVVADARGPRSSASYLARLRVG